MSQTANQWTLFPYNNRHCKVECAISCFHSLGLYSNRFERPHQFLFACTLKQCFTTILPWTKWNHRNREAAAVSNCSNYMSNTMKQSTQRHQSFLFHRLSADAEKVSFQELAGTINSYILTFLYEQVTMILQEKNPRILSKPYFLQTTNILLTKVKNSLERIHCLDNNTNV